MNGKKVFFVRPNSVIQKEMVSELISREYEVLLVPGPDEARVVFRKYPDCLAFLNIDDGPSEEEWESFVDEVQGSPEFSQVKLGILTYNPDPELARKYLMDRGVPLGYVKLSLGLVESTAIVCKVLEASEARGRRQFLRVHCGESVRYNWLGPHGRVEGRILDMSSVGMACLLPAPSTWSKHQSLDSIQLKLKGSLALVNGVVMGSRPAEGSSELAYVVLFDPKMADVQKEKIRVFLQVTLQDAIEAELRAEGV